VIRQTTTDDWEVLRDTRLRALADSPEAFLESVEQAWAFPESLWRERATPDDKRACFLQDEESGMVSCFISDDPANVFLVGMWVAPVMRGTGVARELVESVIDWASEHGAARVCLSVEPGNDRAARLYERCGFAETADPPPFPYEPNDDNRFFVLEL
jgi:GNAT superfamily N-acetyltransferase